MSHSLSGIAKSYCIHGTTKTGTKTCLGTIAVNPNVIPLNKHLHVTWNGGSYDGTSLDTGRDCLNGSILCDLWFPTKAQCDNFGEKQVTVTWND